MVIVQRGVDMNKISWKEAPDWAMYVAEDSNGDTYWYEKEPEPDEVSLMWHAEGRSTFISGRKYDWEDTLVKRPEEVKE